ncbi:hypothetical protein P168DRAFT_292649 [Aspergillus campestris IBT 28561]|uniref:Uncharacterized protein n=1 Tax=Aspergillus campestris (strain IBT 28561) TaxID=1392248 RepID=A0A2I1CV98_ASPC2|nr:uncharacterized protein P168DRAFT_292649 [Aspergillus campestris IBT 28561]PKY01548.1 hypothetical protein P168DRAFT_292649 [Aspergillus campestris IBT 28561]
MKRDGSRAKELCKPPQQGPHQPPELLSPVLGHSKVFFIAVEVWTILIAWIWSDWGWECFTLTVEGFGYGNA